MEDAHDLVAPKPDELVGVLQGVGRALQTLQCSQMQARQIKQRERGEGGGEKRGRVPMRGEPDGENTAWPEWDGPHTWTILLTSLRLKV